ncbi:MAG: Mobile element protein [Burkholderiaceae bacterium]|nr:MAG: Mobile element protein [Burkholderiaceae bacterium]WHZ12447.1 MAG: Mobile element protein [Burkholderiaceae bacterium]
MSQREVNRLGVIKRVMDGALDQGQAAQLLGLSVRQVKRLCRSVREQGPGGLISRKRGRPSNRRIAAERREHYVQLVRNRYADFGPQLAHEYLQREHGFAWSVETLRGWMLQAGLWQAKRRRAKRVHSPRARRQCLGELVQIDGSHHDWFEARSAKCCLIAFIDDATGRVLGARFFEQETTQGYLDVLHALVQRLGAPLALYSDRHGIFTKADPEDAKPTQFERALLQLHIEPICAHSPQAKGRVERLFQTLQDRMCKAMRLQGIDNIEQANTWLDEYLREHNRRFALNPEQAQDMHRPWAGTTQALADICSLHHQRQLSAQGACKFNGSILQLLPHQPHAPKARAMVDIAQHGDGTLHLSYRGQPLAFRSFAVHEPRHAKAEDHKTLNARVDKARDTQQAKLHRLKAELAFQDSQRKLGIYKPDTPPIAPRAGAARFGLRPAQPAPAPA